MHFSQALILLTAAVRVYSSPLLSRNGASNAIIDRGADETQGPPNAIVIPRVDKRQDDLPPPNALVIPRADETQGPPNAIVIPGVERRDDLPPPNALVVPTPDGA
ncbi:hypothetical protein K449DRAFT_394805 [Hypoxylon sp. EC38]|nr:hypothetical protein K449DRAFT_394805 [Hypoxylon sp. EC38]